MKGRLGLARTLVAICSAVWLAPAFATVALSTTVQKVVHETTDDGAVVTKLVDAQKVVPGDELRYTIVFRNDGDKPADAGSIVITNPIPDNTVYIGDTAFGPGTRITYSVDDEKNFATPDKLTVVRDGAEVPASSADYTAIRWTFQPALAPAAQGHVSFNVRLK